MSQPIDWSMAATLRDSVVVVRTRPRAIPLAMIAIRKILHGFPFLSRDAYGAPLGGPWGRRSSANIRNTVRVSMFQKLLANKHLRSRDSRLSLVRPSGGLGLSTRKTCSLLGISSKIINIPSDL